MSMTPFKVLTSRTVVLDHRDVDTDQVIPARFLTTTTRDGLADACFHDWRFDAEGRPKNDDPFAGVDFSKRQILVAGDNFGCGSSREHAPWALMALGFRAVLSSGLGDIFRSNSLKNGLLAIEIPEGVLAYLLDHDGLEVTLDLEDQVLSYNDERIPFEVEPFSRTLMLAGNDSLDMLVSHRGEIEEFERGRAR